MGEKVSDKNVSPLLPHSPTPLLSLLTDFGTSDYYVGAMKGAILSVCPSSHIVDITHEIPPQDIHTAAFTLLASYQTFPKKTIHIAVVDPGVGSNRKAILIQTRDYYFVAPDNGLLSYIAEKEKDVRIFQLTNEKYFHQPVSATFHGRDIFAPVAAYLSCGVKPKKFGKEIGDYVRLDSLNPKIDGKILKGRIINIDRFGNIVTNITHEHLTQQMFERGFALKIGEHEIKKHQNFYAEANAKGEIFIIIGSAGFFEIVAYRDSAASLLGAKTLEQVFLFPNT